MMDEQELNNALENIYKFLRTQKELNYSILTALKGLEKTDKLQSQIIRSLELTVEANHKEVFQIINKDKVFKH